MLRPRMSTMNGTPALISSVRATTCFSFLRKVVELLGVERENAGQVFLLQRIFEGVPGIVHIPMRIVGSKEEPIRSDPVHQITQLGIYLGLLHRLGCVPDVPAHVFGWRTFDIREFAAVAFPDLVQTPGESRSPAE